MSDTTRKDPICGRCGRIRGLHVHFGRGNMHCDTNITDDVFTDQPSDATLLKWMQKRDPWLVRDARIRWQIENGHKAKRGDDG